MKKILLLLSIACATFTQAQNLNYGLQACYPFDNNTQNYATTGAVLNGTLVNGNATTGHTGNLNTAYRLNGNTSSYIQLPDHPGIKSDSVFFSGWFRIDSLPALQYLVYTNNGCPSNFEAYSLTLHYESSLSNYVFCVSKCGSNCGTKPQILSTVYPAIGNWYHVCFYITNSVMKLYVNGALQSSVNHSVQFGYLAGMKVYLGVTNVGFFNKPFKGAVDDVRFYNRELTQQEITLLYTEDRSCLETTTRLENNSPIPGLTIYPNPAADKVYVKGLGGNKLIIYDILGKTVSFEKSQLTENNFELSLQNAAPGVYFVKVIDPKENSIGSTKLILAKP